MDKDRGLKLIEIAEGVTVEDIVVSTGCTFELADPLQPMGQIAIS